MTSPLFNEMSYSSECSGKKSGPVVLLSNLTAVNQQFFELAQAPNDSNISKIALARHPRVASISSLELEDYFKKPGSQAASTRAILIKPSTGSYDDWAQVIETSFNYTSNLKDTSSFAKQFDGTRFGSPAKFDAKQLYIEKKITSTLPSEVSNVVAAKKEDSRHSSYDDSHRKPCERILANQTSNSEADGREVFVENLIPEAPPARQSSRSPEFGSAATPKKPRAVDRTPSRKLQFFSSKPREYTLKDRLKECIQLKSAKNTPAGTASNSKPQSFKNTPTKQLSSRTPVSQRSSTRLDVRILMMEKHKQEIFDSLSKKHRMAFDSAKKEEDRPKTEFERLLDRKRESSLKKTTSASSSQLTPLEAIEKRGVSGLRRQEAFSSKKPHSKPVELEKPLNTLPFSKTMTPHDKDSLRNRIEPRALAKRTKNQNVPSRTPRSSSKPIIAFGAANHLCDLAPFKLPAHLAPRRKYP